MAQFCRRRLTAARRDSLRAFPRLGLRRASRRAAGALAVCMAFVACSPTYDWRTVSDSTNGYAVDLPAKPTLDERTVEIDGRPLPMAMRIAEAGVAVFAVGTVTLPTADAAAQQHVLDYLRAGLARNVGASATVQSVTIPVATGGSVPGLSLDVSGMARTDAGAEHRTIRARILARGAHIYEVTVVARGDLPPEQLDQFFGSFKLF